MGSGELMQTRSSDFSEEATVTWRSKRRGRQRQVKGCRFRQKSKSHASKSPGAKIILWRIRKREEGRGEDWDLCLVFYFLFLSFWKFLQSNDNKRIEYIIKGHSVLSWMPPKTGASVPYTIASCTCGQRWLWAFSSKISLPEVPSTGLNSAFREGCCFCCGPTSQIGDNCYYAITAPPPPRPSEPRLSMYFPLISVCSNFF